jgi:hypothetical protein
LQFAEAACGVIEQLMNNLQCPFLADRQVLSWSDPRKFVSFDYAITNVVTCQTRGIGRVCPKN